VSNTKIIEVDEHMSAPENMDIKSLIIRIMPQIFNTVLSMDVDYSDSVSDAGSDVEQMLGTLEFTGDITGFLRLRVTREFAYVMTAAKRGSQTENIEGDEETQNVISEITDITANHLKAAMTEAGFSCEYSSPSVSSIADAKTDSENFEKLAFTHGEEIAIVELGLSIPEQRQPAEDAEKNNPDTIADTLDNQDELKATEDFDLDIILDIPIEVTVELGRTKIQIHELLKLGPGSAVSLSKLEGEPVEILANDTLIAKGRVVVQDEKYGIRVTEITNRMDRIKSLS
jgi:flagellar motor switch protein FliN